MDSVGLIHMNGRVYDPNIGRFLTPDILIQAPDSSQSFNRYAYVFNNPLTNTDPTGYESGCGGMAGQDTSNCTFIGVPAEGSSVRTVDVVQDDEGNYYYEGVDGNFYSVDKLTEAGYELSFDGDGNLSGITGPSGGGAGSSASGGSPSSNATPGGNVGAPSGDQRVSNGNARYNYTVDHWEGADGEGRTLVTAHRTAESARMRAHFNTSEQFYTSFMPDPLARSVREMSALTPNSYDARVGAANLSAQEMQEGVAWTVGGVSAAPFAPAAARFGVAVFQATGAWVKGVVTAGTKKTVVWYMVADAFIGGLNIAKNATKIDDVFPYVYNSARSLKPRFRAYGKERIRIKNGEDLSKWKVD